MESKLEMLLGTIVLQNGTSTYGQGKYSLQVQRHTIDKSMRVRSSKMLICPRTMIKQASAERLEGKYQVQNENSDSLYFITYLVRRPVLMVQSIMMLIIESVLNTCFSRILPRQSATHRVLNPRRLRYKRMIRDKDTYPSTKNRRPRPKYKSHYQRGKGKG